MNPEILDVREVSLDWLQDHSSCALKMILAFKNQYKSDQSKAVKERLKVIVIKRKGQNS